MKTAQGKTDWVVMGGKAGEMCHCNRCGRGLSLGQSQSINVTVGAMEGFAKDHANCVNGQFMEPVALTPREWFQGRDCGTSSYAICEVMAGLPSPHKRLDAPRDPDDFGRCYRLLNLFPEWKPLMERMGQVSIIWAVMVRHWDEMTALYEEELPARTAPKLYELMQKLRRDAE